MVKVLHYIPGFLYGGIESIFLSWYKNLDHNEVEFELLLRTQDDSAPALLEYKELGGVYYRIPPIRSGLKFYKGISDFFKQHHDYDILHVHSYDPFVMSLAKKNGIETVIRHSHSISSNDKTFKNYFFSPLNKLSKKKYVDYAFACSQLAALSCFNSLSFKGNPVMIIHNAIEVEKFGFNTQIRQTLRKELGINDKFVIGHISRLTYLKNQFFLLDVFNSYLKKNNNSVLLIAGDGPDLDRLKDCSDELGITNSVMFLGYREDASKLYQAMDLFLLPSRNEGLGICLIEAQAAGLPCLISDVVPDEADVTDLVVRKSLQDTPESWADEIANMSSRYIRRDYSKEVSEGGYDIFNETKKLIDVYKDVLN